jgi:selenocysteine-specific elongation factor
MDDFLPAHHGSRKENKKGLIKNPAEIFCGIFQTLWLNWPMRIIGTAGHVDHGKSTLIAALTGTHPDRLKEEQAREMTIELGFGWMTLPNGEEVGIVDVPGHRDFIGNMLSGIGGIDAVLLVIAADEGIMPQTSEHLAILDLLQIPMGLIVLTKTDLASDSEWLGLLEKDIRLAVADTVLKNAPIVRVSAKNKTGMTELLTAIEEVLQGKPARLDLDRPRLPIDRVFGMSGFGTVVTGTLQDGHLSIGDEVQILPSGETGRIRGLQTHKKKEETAVPGSRTAVNISGIETDAIQRGQVVVRRNPTQYQITRRIDARFQLLKDASAALKHSTEVKFFVGASETIGNLRLLGVDEVQPGEECWIQLELRDPVVTVHGDRYILRRPSPSETLGGGMVIDHQPKGRHKRFDAAILGSLESLAQGSPADVLFEAALALHTAPIREIISRSRLEAASADAALKELIESGKLILLEDGEVTSTSDMLAVSLPHWTALHKQVMQIIQAHHENFPLRAGIPREELKSKLKLTARLFNATISQLVKDQLLKENGKVVAGAGHEIKFNEQQQARVQALMRKFESNPFGPPSVKESQVEAGEDVFGALVELGELIVVSTDVVFKKQAYEEIIKRIRGALEERGQITLAEVRDMLGTTRKYIQAVLEHLDAIGMTTRDGDARRLKN